MPRYDDRRDTTRLYVGHLSSRTRSRDLESIFSRYGRVRDVDMKHDFAFVEFSDHRDADDARYHLDGRDVDGSRIVVEFARGTPRGPGGSREFLGKGPPPGSGRCFNCGLDGHWARDCKAGDWKNKCYRCGERGHIERSCKNSPKDVRHSRSPSPRRGRDDSRSRGRRRSYSRSRTPPKRDRSLEREGRRSRSPRYSRSPKRHRVSSSPPPSKGRKRSLTPDESSPRRSISGSPMEKVRADRSDYSRSPSARSLSPKTKSPIEDKEGSRSRSRSPATLNDRSRSPTDGNYNNGSPAGSESP